MSEWQPIETAPREGAFLVTDGKRQAVMAGNILALSRTPGTPHHLSGHHWTHWRALPDPPAPPQEPQS